MRYTHGDTGTRLYRIWKSMKCRCNSSNHPSFKWYGARGINVDPEWNEHYEIFREWALHNGYDNNLELDRIDVNAGYGPMNCRWITHREQTLNRRDTLYIWTPSGVHRLRDYLLEVGVSLSTARSWRSKGILSAKLSERLGYRVSVFGGRGA